MASLLELAQGGSGGRLIDFASPRREDEPTLKDLVTQPGDPDFSRPRAGSQQQVPAARAEYDLIKNKARAQRLSQLLTQMGVDVPEDVRAIAESGYIPERGGLFETIINVIGAPQRVVNLAIQDIVAGREEVRGFQSPTVDDYFAALMGDNMEVALRTGHSPSSTSETLALFGWEEQKSTSGRVMRGVADFVLNVLTDPLTYVTFGGSGFARKVLAEGADSVVRNVVEEAAEGVIRTKVHRNVASRLDELAEKFYREALSSLDEEAAEALTEDALEAMLKGARRKAREAVLRETRDEVITPIVARDFGKLPDEWVPLLPKYTVGGARFSLPFLGSKGLKHGFVLPGTRGLGRKLVGDNVRSLVNRAREIPAFDRVASVLENLSTRIDMDRELTRAVARGELTGGEYMLIRDALANKIVRVQLAEVTARLQHFQTNVVGALRREAKDVLGELKDVESLKEVNRALYRFITTNSNELEIGGKKFTSSSEAFRIAQGFRDYARSVLDQYHKALREVAPEIDVGFIKNYLPQSMTPEARRFLRELANSPEVASLVQALETGESAAGAFYLNQLMNAIGFGGMVEGALGSNRHLAARHIGRTVVSLFDEANVLLFKPDILATDVFVQKFGRLVSGLQPGFIDTVTLNNLLEPVVKEVAEKAGIHLRGKPLRLFNEDPFQVINDYVHMMDQTVQYRHLIDVLEANGLVLKAPRLLDVQATLHEIALRLSKPNVMKRLNKWAAQMSVKADRPKRTVVRQVLAQNGKERANVIRTELSHIDSQTGFYRRLFIDPDTVGSPEVKAKFAVEAVARGAETLFYDIQQDKFFVNADELLRGRDLTLFDQRSVNELIRDGEVMRVDIPRSNVAVIARFNPKSQWGSLMNERALQLAFHVGKDAVSNFDFSTGKTVVQSLRDVVVATPDKQILEDSIARLQRTIRTGDFPADLDIERSIMHDVAEAERARIRSMFDNPAAVKVWKDIDDDVLRDSRFALIYPHGRGFKVFLDSAEDPDMEGFLERMAKEIADADDWRRWWDEAGKEAALLDLTQVRGSGVVRMIMHGVDDVRHVAKLNSIALHGARRVGAQRLSTVIDGMERAVNDVSVARIADLSDEEIYRTIRNSTRMVWNASTKNDQPWAQKLLLRRWTELYGEDFVAAATGAAKEIVEVENMAIDFINTLQKIFRFGLDSSGRISDVTPFAFAPGSDLEKYLKELREYAKHLGINPDTFEPVFTSTPFVDGAGRKFVRPELFAVGGAALEGKVVQKNVAQWFEQLVKNMGSIYTPLGIAELKQSANFVLRWWKTMTTIPRPTFHIRNFVGGLWNNMLIGVRLRTYAQVRDAMITVRRELRRGVSFEDALNKISNKRTREALKAMFEMGVADLSFSSAEFKAMTASQRSELAKKLGLINFLDPENFLLAQSGALFMESIEDFLRAAAFVEWYDPAVKGSARVAKEMALAAHFDYKNLTEFETMIKKFVPFFVWQRRNLPLQLQTLIEKPGMITRYGHLMKATQEQFPAVEQDEFPRSPYMSAYAVGTDIVVNEDTPFWARIIIDPDIPVADVFEVFKSDNPLETPVDLIEYFLDSLGPTYQFVLDFVQQQDYGDVNAPAPMSVVLGQLARAGFFDTTVDGDVQVPYFLRTMYYMILPWSREFEDMLGPSDPARQQRVGQAEGQDDMDRLLTRIGLTLGRGVGVKTQTPTDALPQAAKASDKLSDILAKLIRHGIISEEQWEDFE